MWGLNEGSPLSLSLSGMMMRPHQKEIARKCAFGVKKETDMRNCEMEKMKYLWSSKIYVKRSALFSLEHSRAGTHGHQGPAIGIGFLCQ